MKRFEYKTLGIEMSTKGKWLKTKAIESTEMVTKLNELGQDGWELVSSIDHAIDGYTIEILLLLKREIAVG